ncbi:P-loop containing nucleoside triphosphate hydrolase protein [Wilcoxina mikolae CBS 423.85]|nr:P-loop containing nucleoside triphosphate hydrolase protein [Wilcoxina mikolae CBS 423.85]
MPPKRKNPPSESTASSKKKPSRIQKNTNPTPTSHSIPWPPHFKHLERVHRALNLVYTFCCTRKQLATTFANLKSAVEGHTKKDLTISDIAQIKFLVPKGVHFEYVDEELLQVYIAGGGKEKDKDEAYSMMSNTVDTGKEVLLFEFVDGDLKRSVVKQLDEIQRIGVRREEIKMPTFSTAQMTKLINKRNEKFQCAVDKFLSECAATEEDPVESIKHQHSPFVPAKSSHPSTPGADTIPPEIPTERKSIPEIIEEIKESDLYVGQIAEGGHRIFDPQEAVYGDLTFVLSQHLVNAIYTARNITQLYSHQAEAINNLHDGHNVIVSTSTSSGKSLIYQIPVLHELERDRNSRAMFIFPTKALAQDQKRSLVEVLSYMTEVLGTVVVDTFDGDTPTEERRRIRDEASVIFTNPDMLHLNILPNEEYWRMFLKNLKYVVVDELHVYNGVFGSHVAFIMRRLRRICSAVGNNKVQFVSCSATVANPEAHMRTIFGIDSVHLTDEDGSPSGRKEFLCWNTPYKDPTDPSSGRGDSITEAAKIFAQLILRGVRTISFCRVRTACELMLQAVRTHLQRLERGDVVSRVMGYRGGYTPQDRRRIEKEMFEGHLLGIVATNALELGVDIGSLDAVLIVNFPYSISNLRQQSGRAGRRNKDSLSILIGGAYPIDQHYMSHPTELFTKPNLSLAVDLSNPHILTSHLQCAAHELPLLPSRDQIYFGPSLPSLAASHLLPDPSGFFNPSPRFLPSPSHLVPIRDTEEPGYAVIDTTHSRNIVLEELPPSRAPFTLYEGAIFLHQGRSYLVRSVSHSPQLLAEVEAVNVSYTTSPRDFTDIDPTHTLLSSPLPGGTSVCHGSIQVSTKVFGYFKLDRRNHILDAMNPASAIHAASHAVLSLLPTDGLRSECKAPEKEFAKFQTRRKRPGRLVFYERRAGGGGGREAWEVMKCVLERARERVEECGCEMGCVECCLGSRCSEGNLVVSKRGAGVVLRGVLGMEVDEEKLEGKEEERGLEEVGVGIKVEKEEGVGGGWENTVV